MRNLRIFDALGYFVQNIASSVVLSYKCQKYLLSEHLYPHLCIFDDLSSITFIMYIIVMMVMYIM